MTAKTQLRTQFQAELARLLASISDAAEQHFESLLELVKPPASDEDKAALNQTVEEAIHHGVGIGCARFNDYCVLRGLKMSFELLQDCNAHTEAGPLWAAIQAMEHGRTLVEQPVVINLRRDMPEADGEYVVLTTSATVTTMHVKAEEWVPTRDFSGDDVCGWCNPAALRPAVNVMSRQ